MLPIHSAGGIREEKEAHCIATLYVCRALSSLAERNLIAVVLSELSFFALA